MRQYLYCASDISRVDYAACSSLITQTRCDLKPFAHFERESSCGDSFTQAGYEMMSHKKFQNTFLSIYLMNNYESYLTFSIIIISPAQDRLDGALHVMPNLSRHARHQIEVGSFEIVLFRDRGLNIPKR